MGVAWRGVLRGGRVPLSAPIFPLTHVRRSFSQAASNLALAAGLAAALASASPALAADAMPPPPAAEATAAARPSMSFPSATAPPVKAGEYALPEGAQWRYSEFINAVNAGKVERVRFSKDGSQLQVRLGGRRERAGARGWRRKEEKSERPALVVGCLPRGAVARARGLGLAWFCTQCGAECFLYASS